MLTSDDHSPRRIHWVHTDLTPPTVIPSPTTSRRETAVPSGRRSAVDPTVILKRFAAEHPSHSDLYADTLAADERVAMRADDAAAAESVSRDAVLAHATEQAKDPERRAGLVRQVLFASSTIVLEAGPCYLAAQALGDDQQTTLLVMVLFVLALAGSEFGLDWAKRADSRRAWRRVAAGLGGFIAALGVLRLHFLLTSPATPLEALLGAGLLTAATAVFVLVGYLALRCAETVTTWRLRRERRRAARAEQAAREALRQARAAHTRLLGALMHKVQPTLLASSPNDDVVQATKRAIRAHFSEHVSRIDERGAGR